MALLKVGFYRKCSITFREKLQRRIKKKIFPPVQALIPGQRRMNMHDLSARRSLFKLSFSEERLRTPSETNPISCSVSPCRWR